MCAWCIHSRAVSCFPQGQIDVAEVPKFYLLLHDNCSSVAVPPAGVLKEMRSRLSLTGCHMLTINSLPTEAPNLEQADLWSHLLYTPLFPGEGCVPADSAGDGEGAVALCHGVAPPLSLRAGVFLCVRAHAPRWHLRTVCLFGEGVWVGQMFDVAGRAWQLAVCDTTRCARVRLSRAQASPRPRGHSGWRGWRRGWRQWRARRHCSSTGSGGQHRGWRGATTRLPAVHRRSGGAAGVCRQAGAGA